MGRWAFGVALAFGVLAGCAAEPVSVGSVGSLLSDAERRERAGMIRDVAASRGMTQGWLLAGVADAETQMSHCWRELTWACQGPTHPDCGGGPVVAGAGDGPCEIRQGGLGMFQFDAGTYEETLAREGDRVLSIAGNVDAAVDFVIDMVIRSQFIDGVDTEAQAIEWMNSVRVDNALMDTWAETVTRYYNGCRPTSGCWPERLPRYRSHGVDVYFEMGADFWEGGGSPYRAEFVEQSFPLASQPFVLAPGDRRLGAITLRNRGTETWLPSSTFLTATEPRDVDSVLGGDDWLSPSRAATVTDPVGPGDNGRFEFFVYAPLEEGVYPQFFGLYDEAGGWFSDRGGFPDDQLELRVTVDPSLEPEMPNPMMNPMTPDAMSGRRDGGCGAAGVPTHGATGIWIFLVGFLGWLVRSKRRLGR